jgi:AcrR family transcriptional regulator
MVKSSGPAARRPHGRRSADGGDTADLREAILAATAGLLTDRQFGDLAVSDILAEAGVSRGSFYFYFDGKHDVLAELVRRAVARGHDAAAPWLAVPADPVAALRTGITAGAELWRQSAPVLRAIVENWRTDPRLEALWTEQMQTFTDATVAQINADPRLEALWTEQMQTFTDATVAQINADPRARQRLAGQDIPALASALTWLGERLYYLAATGTPPFDDQDTLVATLLHIWTTALYEDTSMP